MSIVAERIAAVEGIPGWRGRVMQCPAELEAAWLIVRERRPRFFVEIGSAWGGSLYVYAGACNEEATVIGIEQDRSGRFALPLSRIKEELILEAYDATVVLAHSRAPELLEEMARRDQPIYLLHIDGCHRDALKDFAAWRPLLAEGALVLVHDITYRRNGSTVPKDWKAIRERGSPYLELVGPPVERPGREPATLGIGVLWL